MKNICFYSEYPLEEVTSHYSCGDEAPDPDTEVRQVKGEIYTASVLWAPELQKVIKWANVFLLVYMTMLVKFFDLQSL